MQSMLAGKVFSLEVVEDLPGFIAFIITGKNAKDAFKNEYGGLRFQRVPPTEHKGRVHTSTITVAVLPLADKSNKLVIKEDELEWKTCRSSGPGGQKVNKTHPEILERRYYYFAP